jgi:hypothetical protein
MLFMALGDLCLPPWLDVMMIFTVFSIPTFASFQHEKISDDCAYHDHVAKIF